MGISPTDPHRTVLDSLPSHGSSNSQSSSIVYHLNGPLCARLVRVPLYIRWLLRSSPITELSSLIRTTLSLAGVIDILHFSIRLIAFLFTFTSRFPSSDTMPVLRSCLLYHGCHSVSSQVSSEFIPKSS